MTSKKRSKITIISIVFVFLLTTLLGLKVFSPVSTNAYGDSDPYDFKFKQLAVGEDFAIALSYDNQLYGWSLLTSETGYGQRNENEYGQTTVNYESSLGKYYPKNPVRINVTLDSGDFIKKIAATRTTAAFITNNGLIYTWGIDIPDEPMVESTVDFRRKGLLLKKSVDTDPKNTEAVYEPSQITYSLIGDFVSTGTDRNKAIDISGNESNYVVITESKYVVWGNGNFFQTTLQESETPNNDNKATTVYALPKGNYDEFYLGQGYVVARDESDLYYKGKNFYIQPVDNREISIQDDDSTVKYEIGVPFQKVTSLPGARGHFKISNGTSEKSCVGKVENALIYQFGSAFAESGTSDGSAEFIYSNGTESDIKSTLSSVSLGNGFGYYLGTGNQVFFWGNNYNGQAAGKIKNGNDIVMHVETPTSMGLTGVQVVAGKTTMGSLVVKDSNYPFISKVDLTKSGSDGSTDTVYPNVASFKSAGAGTKVFELAQDYFDGDEYISAVLGSDGTVTAWNKDTTDTVKFDFTQSNNNKIVSLTAGYGYNLFALSNNGKIYHIQYKEASGETAAEFYATRIDNFSDGKGKGIQKWTATKLSVEFTTGYAAQNSKVNVKLNYNYSGTLAPDITLDGKEENPYVKITGTNFVNPKLNYVHDAYRINAVYGIKIGYRPVNASTDAFTELSEDVYSNFIEYEKTTEGFSITPKKSTKSQNILIIKFKIESIDNKDDSEAKTYDELQETELAITIGNTAPDFSVLKNASDKASNAGNNSIFPLLDANSTEMKYYSIALMDVSTGLEKIAELTGNYTQSSDRKIQLSDTLLDIIKKADDGFPKALTSNYSEYLSYNKGYFNNTYKYLASDPDGDRIYLADIDRNIKVWVESKYGNTYESKAVTLSIPIQNSTDDNISEFTSKLNYGNEYSETFNNLYGFYDISVVKSAGTNYEYVLNLTYDTILFTAKASTNSVTYGGSDSKANVADPKFLNNSNSADVDKFAVLLGEQYPVINEDEGNVDWKDTETIQLREEFIAHVQSTLSMKDTFQYNGAQVFGKSGNNVYKYEYTKLQAGTTGAKSRTISISEFFTDTSSQANIRFTFNGEKFNGESLDFKERFNEKLIDVELTKDTFTFTPKAGGTSEVLLEIMRFDDNGYPFVVGSDSSEIIYIYVKLEFVSPDFTLNSNRKTQISINTPFTVSIKDKSRYMANDDDIPKFTDVKVSDSSVVDISLTDTEVTFTPKKSGKIKVDLFAQLYNESLIDSFELTVVSIAEYTRTYSIYGEEKIYLEDIKAFLQKANADSEYMPKDLNDLIVDRSEAGDNDKLKGFTLQQYIDGAWRDKTVEELDFLASAEIASDVTGEYLDLEVRSIGSYDVVGNTRVVIRFLDKNNTSNVFTAAIGFSPSNKLIQAATDTPFVLNVVYNENFPEQGDDKLPSRDPDTNTYTIPLVYLTGLLPDSGTGVYKDAKISYISAQNDYDTFFDLDKMDSSVGDCILITPKYPTKTLENDYATVNVAIRTNDGNGYLLSFNVRISGIKIDLDKKEYGDILLISFLSVFALLFLVFMVRMAVYWKRKAQQRRIIRKNQMLIKMRDKMHSKNSAVPKEQIVKTKLKMEDPKYAKMFEQMRQKKEEETGISLDNSAVAKKAKQKTKANEKAKAKGKKGKKGKKSIEELKAELEAKKMAFAQMQMDGGVPPMDSGMGDGMDMDMSGIDLGGETMFEADAFAETASVEPDFENSFIDPDSIQIDDLSDN